MTQRNRFRETAAEDALEGRRVRVYTRYRVGDAHVAIGMPGSRGPNRIRYLAHNMAHNIESTLLPHVYGPDASFSDYFRECEKAGNLKIVTRQIALSKRSTDGPQSITLEAGGHRLTVVPEWDWAITEYLGVMASGHRKHGEFWFPQLVTSSKTLSDLQGGWTTYRDEIVLTAVDTAAEIPKDALSIPEPNPGDPVAVTYPQWDPDWEDGTVELREIRNKLGHDHHFVWSETLNEKDARLWEASLPWRDSGRVRRALEPRPGEAFGYGDAGAPLPFVSKEGDRIVWAIYDPAAVKMIPVDRLPQRVMVEQGEFTQDYVLVHPLVTAFSLKVLPTS